MFDFRDQIGVNRYAAHHPDTDVLVHIYGLHIFHTDDAEGGVMLVSSTYAL